MKTGTLFDNLKLPSNVKETKQELHLFPCAHLFPYRQIGMDVDNVHNLHRVQPVSECRHHQASHGEYQLTLALF